MMTIYQVLLQHRGPILKFTVSIRELESCPQIDQLIHFVSKNGIQELTFHIYNGGPYRLPSSLFSCRSITHLDLFSCMFKPPPGFKGFSKLICLKLHEVVIAGDTLASLISGCPLLEQLTIQRSPCVAHFVVSSVGFISTHLAKLSMYLVSSLLNLVSEERAPYGSGLLTGTFPVVELLELDYYHLMVTYRY